MYLINIFTIPMQKKGIIFFLCFLLSTFSFSQSVLRSGEWVKIRVQESGIYKVSYEDLVAMGFSSISNVSIYGVPAGNLPLLNSTETPSGLQQIPIYKVSSGSTFTEGDYILFYGESPHTWEFDSSSNLFLPKTHTYSSYNYYFVTINQGVNLQITEETPPSENATSTITTFTERLFYEKDEVNPIRSGREWYEYFTEKTIDFAANDIDVSKDVRYFIRLAGRDPSASRISISVNGISFPTIETNGTSTSNPYAYITTQTHTFSTTKNTISLSLKALTTGINSRAYLDFASIYYTRKLQVNSGQLLFRSEKNASSVAVFELVSNQNLTIWDVTNPLNPKKLRTNFASNKTTFKSSLSSDKEFIASTSTFLQAEFVSTIANQDLLSNTDFEMLIIAPEIYHDLAQELASVHGEYDKLRTKIVVLDDIFNEFSGGKPDVAAIRNYIRYIYDTKHKLEYVLLFGDGSYDNRDFDVADNTIMTFQSKESLSSYASFISDDFFGIIDPNTGVNAQERFVGELKIAIGRFPVNTIEEAEIVTRKTIEYITNDSYRGDWQNDLCFVADDADKNERFHMSDADLLTKNIASNYPEFNFTKIYLDSYKQEVSSAGQRYPHANIAIDNALKKGCLVLNYTGHGSETLLAAEHAVSKATVSSWFNTKKLPLFITASCEVARYDDDSQRTLGEHLLLEKNGGAIALFSTTRVVFAFSNYVLNKNIYQTLFLCDSVTGEPLPIGKSFIKAKELTPNDFNQNKHSFTLLGDPALRLATPKYKIILDSINGNDATTFSDTLKALSVTTIHGHVVDGFGTPASSYNGTLTLRLFDKSQTIETLGNDGNNTFTFQAYTNLLFRGKAEIENGTFSCSFIVPQDIFYYPGTGRLSMFCDNNTIQGNGIYTNVPIFGTNTEAPEDNEGPSISIYMNDTLFEEGQQTHENPRLFVRIFDPSGINISSSAIGHDIAIILDNGTDQIHLTLNDFYSADKNTFASGTLEYPFTNLEPGHYTLTITVWDTYNNYSEQTIEFYVTSIEKITISSLINYPNPFKNSTTFRFKHNQADKDITAIIRIYNMQGALIKTITHNAFVTGFTDESIFWDGTTDGGSPIQKGMYLYTLSLKTEDGLETIASQKIIVLQ